MAVDRYPIAKYYAERAKGNVTLPMSCSNGKFIELIWPTIAMSPKAVYPDSIKPEGSGSVSVEVEDTRILYALGASPKVTWAAIFQEPPREVDTDPEFPVELDTALAAHIGGDSATAIMKRRGRAQIYFYDKYEKNYYAAYFLVDFRILPVGPITLYVDPANGSPQSIKLTCYGYPGSGESWRLSGGLTAYKILNPSPSYTSTSDITGTGTISGKNSSIIFTAAKKGTVTIEYFDANNREAKNDVVITVADGTPP